MDENSLLLYASLQGSLSFEKITGCALFVWAKKNR